MKVKRKNLIFALVPILVSLVADGKVEAGNPFISTGVEAEEANPKVTLPKRSENNEDDFEVFNQRGLEFIYRVGLGFYKVREYLEASICFKEAAEWGFGKAQYMIGTIYRDGLLGEKSPEEALKWLEKAAKQDVIEAEFDLGVMYYNQGLISYALKYFRRAADRDCVYAKCNLGIVYKNNFKKYEESLKWFLEATEEDLDEAQYNIGIMYRDGLGLEPNLHKALKWFKKAAEQGHAEAKECVIESQYNIVVNCYNDGNYDEAIPLLKETARAGHPGAQYCLGTYYQNGWIVRKNTNKALKWFKQAAENTDPDWLEETLNAQYNLGVLYCNDPAVPRNVLKSLMWFERAAVHGHSDAQRAVELLKKRK